MVRLNTSLNVLDIPFFSKSFMMELVRYQPCSLYTNICMLVVRFLSLWMTSCDTPKTRRSTWNESFPLTTLLKLQLPATSPSHPVAAAADSKHILRTFFELALMYTVVDIRSSHLSEISLFRYNQAALSCEQWWHAIVCQNVMPFSCALARRIQFTASWAHFYSVLLCALSGVQHVTLELFFNLVSPGIQGIENHSLSSFSAICSPCNESRLQDWHQIEWASSVK